MAVLFVEAEDRENILFKIQDDKIFLFEKIIDDFNSKYNDLFDIYSDFRLYENHIQYLSELSNNYTDTLLVDFNTFLKKMKSSNKIILVLGE